MGIIKTPKKKINRKALTFQSGAGGNSVNITTTTTSGTTNNNHTLTAQVVSTTNITQSGLSTIDGISIVSGDIVLCTGKTDQKLNGLFYASSGAWSRIENQLLASHLVFVLQGTAFGGSIWKNTNTVNPTIGISTITYIKPFLFSANNLSDIANISTSRSNLGLGTMATQNNTSVSIVGGNITGLNQLSVTGSNSNLSVGSIFSANITSKSNGTITLHNSGGLGANFRLLQGAVDGVFPLSSGAGMTFQMTNTSNVSPFLYLIRNRIAGNSTIAVSAEVQTNNTLHTDDKVSFNKRIVPSSGVSVSNYFQTGISDTSSSVPSSYEDIIVTEGGISVRSARFAARMVQICRSTSGAVRLFVSNTIATTYDLIFPDTAPAENNILVYNSGGQAAWHRYSIPQTITTDTTAKSNSHYIINGTGAGEIILTLPTAANSKVGDTITITRAIISEKDWRISQQDNQQIVWNTVYTTIGTTGWAESDSIDSTVNLLCIVNDATNTRWQIIQHEGDVVLV